MSFLWSLFGFQQGGVGPIADGVDGKGTQDAAITLELPTKINTVPIADRYNPGQVRDVELFGNKAGRYIRMLLGLAGYVNTSLGNGTSDRFYAMADGPLGNGTHLLPELGYSGMENQGRAKVSPVPPGGPPGPAQLGGAFPGQYVGRVEREARAYR